MWSFSTSMAAVNRLRGNGIPMGNENLEGDGDFITHYDNPVEDDIVPIINNLELLKQEV